MAKYKIGMVAAEFNYEITSLMVARAKAQAEFLDVEITKTIMVPGVFDDMLAREIKEKKENILDFDLIVYNAEEPAFVGLDREMLSSPRLDNITSCLALVDGYVRCHPQRRCGQSHDSARSQARNRQFHPVGGLRFNQDRNGKQSDVHGRYEHPPAPYA